VQITVDDKEIYEGFIQMRDDVADIKEAVMDFKTCSRDHEERIIKLESNSKQSTIQDWLKKGGIGVGATGLAGTLYLLLDKLLGLGGT
jgi:hypothetical protein